MFGSNHIPNKRCWNADRTEFTNRHGVKFEMQDFYTVNAEARWIPPEGEVDIYFEFYAELEEFARELKIESAWDLLAIDLNCIRQLYLEGKGQIICWTGTYDVLSFSQVDGKLFVQNERFVKHKVTATLEGPEDFIKYTSIYHTLMSSCEN